MRRLAADYLEAEKLEELVDELSRDGYRVEREARLGNQKFDLVAQRDGELRVFEVKARSRLAESVGQLARLRTAALEARVAGFHLVVVNPPREIDVTIEGLDRELTRHLRDQLPATLDRMSSATQIDRVKRVEVDAVDVGAPAFTYADGPLSTCCSTGVANWDMMASQRTTAFR